jgi:dTMP kinase
MTQRGRFITFEGGEGAGKTTQLALLARHLRAKGVAVLTTREPGGTAGADILRDLLLSGQVAWSTQAEIFLHCTARAEHIAKSIRPALERGAWVLCDRYYDSTMVYQGHALGGDLAQIADLARMMNLTPDLTLVFDVPVEVSTQRLGARGLAPDRYERLGADFFARVRAGFQNIVENNPERCRRIDGVGDQADIFANILGEVTARFPLPNP